MPALYQIGRAFPFLLFMSSLNRGNKDGGIVNKKECSWQTNGYLSKNKTMLKYSCKTNSAERLIKVIMMLYIIHVISSASNKNSRKKEKFKSSPGE